MTTQYLKSKICLPVLLPFVLLSALVLGAVLFAHNLFGTAQTQGTAQTVSADWSLIPGDSSGINVR